MLLLAFTLFASPYTPEGPVDWRDAASCLGQLCSVRGTVAVTDPDGAAIRLYFDEQQRDVRVLLMRGWFVTWPQYDGHTIIATGKVGRFRDHIELIVRDPSNIVVVGGTPTATPSQPVLSTPTPSPASPSPAVSLPTATPPAPSPSPGEVEELRLRVRELEERVRELEGR